MGYRRAHHRRAHTRINSDGSKSYVKEAYVKGHEFNRKPQYNYSNTSDGNWFDEFLMLLAASCLFLFYVGSLLMWEDTLWYLVVFILSGAWFFARNK